MLAGANGCYQVLTSRSLAVLAAFVLTATDAAAVCVLQAPCQMYWESHAVFVGTVADVRHTEVAWTSRDDRMTAERVRLTVVEAFRGVSQQSVTVFDVLHSEAVRFQIGRTYFVYAHRNERDGALHTSGCGAWSLSESAKHLMYARWIQKPRTQGLVFGTISHSEWDPGKGNYVGSPLPEDLTLSLTGSAGSWRVRPFQDGGLTLFRFDAIPPGTYALAVHASGPYDLGEPADIELAAPQLCYELNVEVHWLGIVRGRLIDADGRPVPNAGVTIVSGRPTKPHVNPWRDTAITDERGEFTIRHLPAGEYTVGLYIDDISRWERKHPAIYFPGVTEPEAGHTVTVTRGSDIDTGDLMLPVAVRKVPVTGTVVLPDGAPVPDAWVSMRGQDETSFEDGLEVKTDGSGRFRLPGVAGRRYQVSASVHVHETFYSGSAELTAGEGAAVTLRLSRDGP